MYKSNIRIFGEGIDIYDKSNILRENTIKCIYELLIKYNVLQIRCPPFSGKTSVGQLIELYINKETPSSRIVSLSLSALSEQIPFLDLFKREVGVDWEFFINDASTSCFIIFDEAQSGYYVDQYKTEHLWKIFKNAIPVHFHILFLCSYTEALSLPTSPVKFRSEQTIYLFPRSVDIGGGNMINMPGLVATDQETKQLFINNPIGTVNIIYYILLLLLHI